MQNSTRQSRTKPRLLERANHNIGVLDIGVKQAKPSQAKPSLAETIWQWVAAIPPGKVASYGQIAKLAGYPSHSRYVGTTLRNLPKDTTLPWFRVLRSSGELAFPPGSAQWQNQKQLLVAEGILLTGNKVKLAIFSWQL